MKNFLDIKPLLNRFVNENSDIVDSLNFQEIFEAMCDDDYLIEDLDTFNLALLFFSGLDPNVTLAKGSEFYGGCYEISWKGEYVGDLPAYDGNRDVAVTYWAPEWSLGFIYSFKFPKEITTELIRKIGKAV